MKTKSKITWEQIFELIPGKTSLVFVDRNDCLDDHTEMLQRCIEEKSFEEIHEKINEWYWESEESNVDDYCKEIANDLVNKYNITEEEAKEITDTNRDSIRDVLYDNCTDNTLSDLLSNTGRLIMHYDTGYYMEAESWCWKDYEIRYERIKIKKHLGIPSNVYTYNEQIDMMIQQASYGGQLLIYFNLKDSFVEFVDNLDECKSVVFKDYVFGIIDHCNGSGDICDIEISNEAHFSLNENNFFFEKSIKYNWTYSIAGMCEDWADNTDVVLSKENSKEKIEDSPQVLLQKLETKYNQTFKDGGCTSGDMDIKRHRNTPYRNNFPCGNKCTECGTFWID